MTAKKAFLLRIDPTLWSALERLAQAELRSVNAEIEYLLREALRIRGIAPGPPPEARVSPRRAPG
ncbi:MAG: toxin-antitoxin system HicB family antitoxin [Proteobacteria bacterium]|nr:toxin-antitoxin system HicB family antitoxin [Pseudomonadota bacterium]